MASPPTLENPMAGYDPNGITPQPQVAQAPATTGYEFDPKKEIDPMAGKFFDTVENDPRLSRSAKTRLQTGYLNGIDDIQAQRRKLEDERLRGIMDRQSIERNNMALAEARQKQDAVARAAEQQKGVADTVKGIIASNLPPEEKRKQIAMFEIDNAATLIGDPATRAQVEAAKGVILKPDPLYSTSDMRDKIEKGIPPEVVLRGNPEEIGFYERTIKIGEERRSTDKEVVKEARKRESAQLVEFSKFKPEFIAEDDLPADVSRNDPNRLKYLTPESQYEARKWIGALGGKDALTQYETLSDADKKDFIRDMQIGIMSGKFEEMQRPIEDTVEENAVDSLLFGTKKK
jgi:hypothetical protein